MLVKTARFHHDLRILGTAIAFLIDSLTPTSSQPDLTVLTRYSKLVSCISQEMLHNELGSLSAVLPGGYMCDFSFIWKLLLIVTYVPYPPTHPFKYSSLLRPFPVWPLCAWSTMPSHLFSLVCPGSSQELAQLNWLVRVVFLLKVRNGLFSGDHHRVIEVAITKYH